MVSMKSALALGLLAATASEATIGHEKRHVHHRRGVSKKPCTTASPAAPFPVGNSTQPAGTGVPTTTVIGTSTTKAVVTISVIPVPASPPAENPTAAPVGTTSTGALASSAPAVVPSAPAVVPSAPAVVPSSPAPSGPAGPAGPGSPVCGAVTSYVTVQQTVTVTAGQEAPATSAPAVVAPAPSSSSVVSAPSNPPPPPPPAATPTTSVAAVAPAPTPKTTQAPAQATQAAPSPSAAQSSAAPQAPVSSTPYTGSKMGTSWVPGVSFDSLGLSGVSWVYNWEQTATGVPQGVQFIPTLHDAAKCANFGNQLASQPGVTQVKHFNEPDMYGNGGSGLSPGAAASLHNQYIKPLTSKYEFGMPAVTSNNIPGSSGTGWLEAFMSSGVSCSDFKFADFHFYGGSEAIATQANIFLGYVDNWVKTVDQLCPGQNLPIWITEFSAGPANGNAANAEAFMKVAGPKLESNPRVARWSYFFPSNNDASSVVSSIKTALKAVV